MPQERETPPDENIRLYGDQPTTYNAYSDGPRSIWARLAAMFGYPNEPLLDPGADFPDPVLEALARFKATNPWLREGPENTRTHKFNTLLKELRTIYGVDVRANYRRITIPQSDSGGSHYNSNLRLIVMKGRFSVVTFLHEFGHALGMNEHQATYWSVNLFARTFPEKMPALEARGHMLVRRMARKVADECDEDEVESDGGRY